MGKASMNNIQPTSIGFAATAVGAKQVAKHRRENNKQHSQDSAALKEPWSLTSSFYSIFHFLFLPQSLNIRLGKSSTSLSASEFSF
jgi:hypothetical protein